MNEGPYRQHPGPPAAQYHQHHALPPYHQQQHPAQAPAYGDRYNQIPASRGPLPENMGPIEGGRMSLSLAPGVQPPKPEPLPISRVENGRKYELMVVQQPRRARMCGFGDKDRRPITPPPCVRLIITDGITGKEIDCNDIDHAMFVLNVDLWSHDGKGEVNLVRHTTQSPSISASQSLSYAETRPIYAPIQPQQQQQFKDEPGQSPQQAQPPYNPYPRDGPPQVSPYVHRPPGQEYAVYYQHGYGPHDVIHPSENGHHSPPQQQGGQQMYPAQTLTGAQIHAQGRPETYPPQSEYQSQQVQQQLPQNPRQPHSQQPQGMFTRNLIGSLAASAFRLTDTDDRIGIWFVLQDLSVRTEGHFRLRFSFVNVGAPTAASQLPTPGGAASPSGNGLHTANINTGKAPILAQCFSEVFTVYSAKKFPGVVESTPLSKCFATQGIKIPIRKDGPGGEKGKKGGDFDDDD